MRIGLVEFLLLLAIGWIAVGPQIAVFVDRWTRRAKRTNAAAARRRAEYAAQMAAERDAVLKRFRVATSVIGAGLLLALAYALLLRPVATPPQSYTPSGVRQAAGQTIRAEEQLALGNYQEVSCLRVREGWLYASVRSGKKKAALVRVREDGTGLSELVELTGEITGFDFDPEGNIWFLALTEDGGALYRVSYDGWGAAAEQIVSQINGKALLCPTAVAVAADGKVYFADGARITAEDGTEQALRTELIAHTATGWVYVYDPAALTVQKVLGGVAGASGLALDPTGKTLYVSDLASRCIWQVSADARERTAGGKECGLFATDLPGYPGALAVDEEGAVYVSYRWSRSGWLESNADSSFLRSIALRAGLSMQEKLFGLDVNTPAAEMLAADGSVLCSFTETKADTCTALCPSGSRVYLGTGTKSTLFWAGI